MKKSTIGLLCLTAVLSLSPCFASLSPEDLTCGYIEDAGLCDSENDERYYQETSEQCKDRLMDDYDTQQIANNPYY